MNRTNIQQRTRGTKETEETRGPGHSSSLESFPSLSSLPENVPSGFIPPHGGYQNLLAYQKSLGVFQTTQYFRDRFIDRKSRTFDQMVQAARSGKQNILEGSQASGTSKETELKRTIPERWRPA